jgi:glycosyltransferase involved in cell wall biosynthesis
MACGVPVVTSDRSSIPEIAGDAAILVDPREIEEIADAVYRVITNSSLREELIQKGLMQSKKYSWEKTARNTLALYLEVMNEAA